MTDSIHVFVEEITNGEKVTHLRWSLSDGRIRITGSDPIRPEGHPERTVSCVLGMIIVNAVKLFNSPDVADEATPLCCSIEFHRATT